MVEVLAITTALTRLGEIRTEPSAELTVQRTGFVVVLDSPLVFAQFVVSESPVVVGTGIVRV